MKEMVGGCCVCSDDRGWPENPLVYCDGQSCTVAVHQACYGIVTVPTGPWYCRKCESQERSVKVKCELCPSKYGALKRTDNSGWAHVVCALYIPEVRFGNVTTMEPIQLQLIPQERFTKVCYICEENGKPSNASIGACMQCNKSGCKQQFHVTCAQSLGLLCEEAGNFLDNVKYCGYCQHHYGKLKKGGNVKTIPPYKPVSSENPQSDSSSEKEQDSKLGSNSTSLGKRKSSSSSNSKTVSSKVSNANVKSSVSAGYYQKSVANQKGNSDKAASKNNSNIKNSNNSINSAKSVISDDSVSATDNTANEVTKKLEIDIQTHIETSKDSKSKKRKANSRTPTPNIVNEASNSAIADNTAIKKEVGEDKAKKAKTESSSPHSASSLPSSTATVVSPPTVLTPTTDTISATSPAVATNQYQQSIIQSTTTHQSINSVVVSVPLQNTQLSPRSHSNQSQPIKPTSIPSTANPPEDISTNTRTSLVTSDVSNPATEENMITSDMSGGPLKISFEKQSSLTTPPVLQVELEDVMANQSVDVPIKRSRSQSTDKIEKHTRAKKKSSNGVVNSLSGLPASSLTKRSSRSQHNTPPPPPPPTQAAAAMLSSAAAAVATTSAPTSFAGTLQQQQQQPPAQQPQQLPTQIKESPPSSPSSESLGAPPSVGRKKGRKSAPASVSGSSSNQLNLNSNMAQKMTDHLNSELEAHSIYSSENNNSNLIGPQLHHRVIANARSSSTGGSSTASGGSGLSSMLSGNGGAIPQTLDQLLERQWEQGSQFLMEQAQHFDIASLLSCLHQLRAENLRLEEHVSSLLQRRDHLLAVNARLAIPLTGPPAAPQTSHPHTVNNIHPAVASTHADTSRGRNSGGSYGSGPMENGISDQGYPPHPHRSPAGSSQSQSSTPNIRQSSNYNNIRQGSTSDTTVRAASRGGGAGSAYSHYSQAAAPNSNNQQQQIVIRRESEQPQNSNHHNTSSNNGNGSTSSTNATNRPPS
ncbi:PREDICTED: protein AF-10 isoform X2 [Nicrophorus vespilloides]|uniref:Protein AF-10 isoform X2 n=1 Tax=Nicrophorus vespilloides TaxID=110193 RepID=A0ABM1M819_NICVS|nr:PREDICTED: protein AF-10 isoform X2 [Nicrophorus vespilloides]